MRAAGRRTSSSTSNSSVLERVRLRTGRFARTIDPGQGLFEVALGLALIDGLLTRASAVPALEIFTLTLFALPDDPVFTHVAPFEMASVLLITGGDPYAVDDYLERLEIDGARASRPAPSDAHVSPVESVDGRRVRVAEDVMFGRRDAAKPPVDCGLEAIARLDDIVSTPAEAAAVVRGDDEHVQSVL